MWKNFKKKLEVNGINIVAKKLRLEICGNGTSYFVNFARCVGMVLVVVDDKKNGR